MMSCSTYKTKSGEIVNARLKKRNITEDKLSNSGIDISVIIPVYNGESTIHRAVRSVLSQKGINIEVIIINDASEDNTLSVLEKLARKDSRIRIISNAKNLKQGISRYIGIQASRGNYIGFLDADDKYYRGALRHLLSIAYRNNSDIVFGSLNLYFPRLFKSIRYFNAARLLPDVSGHSLFKRLLTNDMLAPSVCDKIYRGSLLREQQFYSFGYVGEDFLMNMQVYPCADRIDMTSRKFYKWTFTGLGYKYFKERWPMYEEMIDRARSILPAICKNYGIDSEQALSWLEEGRLKNLRERIIQIYLNHGDYKKIVESESIPVSLVHDAINYLHSHKKFYNFIRIMHKIHGV